MRVLQLHNYYQQPGGEDRVVAAEADLLASHGGVVEQFEVRNDQVGELSPLVLAGKTVWNASAAREVRDRIRQFRPQVMHVHNTLPLLSPAVYYAARAEGIPVVQTLHNYRLLCPSGLLFRDGEVCEDCVGWVVPLPGVARGCHRGSRAVTAATATMLSTHRAIGTWRRMVDQYIALTEFARAKFIEGGLPGERIAVKPNFVSRDPGARTSVGDYALFVGRVSLEKGLDTLIAAWNALGTPFRLKVAGDGPDAPRLRQVSRDNSSIEWLGHTPREEVLPLMRGASFLVVPSRWYEGFPLTMAEAFAVGLPVLASDLGSMSSLVHPGRNGLRFRPGDAGDLARQIQWALSHPEAMVEMGRSARREFEEKYTAERNYEMLMEIYRRATEIASAAA